MKTYLLIGSYQSSLGKVEICPVFKTCETSNQAILEYLREYTEIKLKDVTCTELIEYLCPNNSRHQVSWQRGSINGLFIKVNEETLPLIREMEPILKRYVESFSVDFWDSSS
jgi:hypothetical protein